MRRSCRDQRVVDRPTGRSGLGQPDEQIDRGLLVEKPAVGEIGGEEPTDGGRSPTRKSGQAGRTENVSNA